MKQLRILDLTARPLWEVSPGDLRVPSGFSGRAGSALSCGPCLPRGCTSSHHLGGRGLEPLGWSGARSQRGASPGPAPWPCYGQGRGLRGWSSSQKQLSARAGSLVRARGLGAALVNQWRRRLRICLQWEKHGFDPWARKIPWRREWPPTPVFFPGELHAQGSLAGYSPWSHKESDTTE